MRFPWSDLWMLASGFFDREKLDREPTMPAEFINSGQNVIGAQ
jgi:hypothetical protein